MIYIKEKFKAIIFDMDGTIIKSEHVWEQATKDILATRGFTTFTQAQHDFLCSLSGTGLINASKLIKKEFNLADPVEVLIAEKKVHAKKYFGQNLSFIEGFESFHQKLQQLSIPTSIASNADQGSINILAKSMNFSKFFGNNIYSIEVIGNKAKPDPSIFLHAAKQLHVDPSECLVFEDSLVGFQAAQSAGMKCIAIKNNLNQDKLHLVDHAIENYHEAEEALRKISSK